MRQSIPKHFLGTVLVGVFAARLFALDWTFASQSRPGRATVLAVPNPGVSRSGRSMADVVVETRDSRQVGTLRAWYRPFAPGQQVDVLYLPDDPGCFYLNRFWQCYYGSIVGFIALAVVATAEGFRFGSLSERVSLPPRVTKTHRATAPSYR